MLEVSTLRSPSKADQRGFVGDHVGFLPTPGTDCCDDFMVDDNLLDYIDFSCDVPFFDADGDILPDLEVDPTELLAEFSSPEGPADDGCQEAPLGENVKEEATGQKEEASTAERQDEKRLLEDEKTGAANGEEGSSAVTTEDSAVAGSDTKSWASAEGHSKKKSSASGKKNSNAKRKVKVDWTPELHRRFVQAVEQLGIDKAVPSRILEIMGMDCLTRHNIASHLQKYRSHRKHLMAREAEAASWARKRQMRKEPPAAIGFPPPPFCRPLHVWGHPPAWPYTYWLRDVRAPPPSPPPCFVPPAAGQLPRFPAYRPLISPPPQSISKLATLQLQLDAHPSKESIDAAIGDVLGKPWLPLPLGLKPPSLGSVMAELHKQGIPNIPPPAKPAGSR